MSTTNALTGGSFQDSLGDLLVNGYLIMQLSQDAQVNGTTQITAGSKIRINLNSSGSVSTSPNQSVWPNDVLSPSGTFYIVTAYSANGQLVWGPNPQQVLSTPSPFDIGAWVPAAVNVGLGGSGTLVLKTNGANNSSQTLLNLTNVQNINLTDLGSGDISIGTNPTISVVNNVPSFVNTTGKLQDSGVDALDIVLRSSNNQFGNTLQTFGLTGSGEVQVSNTGITVINTSLATVATIDTATGTGAFSSIATSQVPSASATASDHSIPIKCNGVTYYIRLSTTP